MKNAVDQFLFDALLLADSWSVPESRMVEVAIQETQRFAERDQEPTFNPDFTNPYQPLRF